jgi:hypothetical protein
MVKAERAKNASEPQPLPGFGPDFSDKFRFTWWNTQAGDAVWIEHRGQWRAGVVISRGRKYVEVTIANAGGRQHRVSKPYSELRRPG